MRSVHFRISHAMWSRIREEAEAEEMSVGAFAREAAIIRASVYAFRREQRWTDSTLWDKLAEVMREIEREDARRRKPGT